MSWNTNNNHGLPFGWRDYREQSGYYIQTPQQYAPVIGNPSTNNLETGEPRRESHGYIPGFASDTASWSNNVPPDHSFSGYRGGEWPSGQYLEETRLGGSISGAPGSGTAGPGMSLYGGVAALTPVAQSPAFQAWPPPSGIQTSGSHWQPTSWPHPVHPAGQYGNYSNPVSSLGTRPEVPPLEVAGTSANIDHLEQGTLQTGYPPLVSTPNNPASRSGPVPAPATTSSARGERWNPPDAATFRCMWTTHGMPCSAYIPGDRKYVTAHLRDEHGFTCDGMTIACGWARCTAHIQRRNIPRHIVAYHLEIKVPCADCGLPLSRADAGRKHRLACPRHRTTGSTEAAEED